MRVLFLTKAKRPGDDRTQDMFGLTEKRVGHKGYVTKQGRFVAPHEQRHKVRTDDTGPDLFGETEPVAGVGAQARDEDRAKQSDHWDALAGKYGPAAVAAFRDAETRNQWSPEFVSNLTDSLGGLPPEVRDYFDWRAASGNPVLIVHRTSLDNVPPHLRGAYEAAAALCVNGMRIEFIRDRKPTLNSLRHELVHYAWYELYGDQRRDGMAREVVAGVLDRIADEGEKMLALAHSRKAKRNTWEEIDAQSVRKTMRRMRKYQKEGKYLPEILKGAVELELMIGGGYRDLAKAAGVRGADWGNEDGGQYRTVALYMGIAKRLGVEMDGAFAKEEGVAYLCGEDEMAAREVFGAMKDGMERATVERGEPKFNIGDLGYRRDKLIRERGKSSDPAAVDAEVAMLDEQIQAARDAHAHVMAEYARKHPRWYDATDYGDGEMYYRLRKTPGVPMAKSLILLKAQRKDAAGTLDMFGALQDKEIQHKGYVNKKGTFVAPHGQKHKVREEGTKPWAMTREEYTAEHRAWAGKLQDKVHELSGKVRDLMSIGYGEVRGSGFSRQARFDDPKAEGKNAEARRERLGVNEQQAQAEHALAEMQGHHARAKAALDSRLADHEAQVREAIKRGDDVPAHVAAQYQAKPDEPKTKPALRFNVDDKVIFSGNGVSAEVIFRGYNGPDKAVIYNPKSGFQREVPVDQLIPAEAKPAAPPIENPINLGEALDILEKFAPEDLFEAMEGLTEQYGEDGPFPKGNVVAAGMHFKHTGTLARREQAKHSLLEKHGSDNPVGLEVKHRDSDRYGAILPDASEPGRYRYSLWDKRGFYTHSTYDTPHEALSELVKDGFTEHAPGSLDKMSATQEWAEGMKINAEIQKRNEESFARSWERAKVAGLNDKRTHDFPVRLVFDHLPYPGHITFNATRPVLGTKAPQGRRLEWEDDFIAGRFYAAVDPDEDDAEEAIKRNREMDAKVLRYLEPGRVNIRELAEKQMRMQFAGNAKMLARIPDMLEGADDEALKDHLSTWAAKVTHGDVVRLLTEDVPMTKSLVLTKPASTLVLFRANH